MRLALTIAGSDSGGGAGIQADLKAFTKFGVFGMSVITAITAQNTLGVTTWEAVSPELVRAQLDAVATDLRPYAVKTGMLGDPAVVDAVSEGVAAHGLQNALVVDPVMVATSGDLLLTTTAVEHVRSRLIPLARLVTPNLDEAKVLLGADIPTLDAMYDAAKRIVHEFGAQAALVKGGHLLSETTVSDVLYDGVQHYVFEHPRLVTNSTHGTGCTLSAAITANLALGADLRDAVQIATDYVARALATAPGLGSGHGPVNHFA